VLLALVLAPALQAQIQAGGLPPSVTSIGFSPSPVAPGIPPSVTSLGFGQPGGFFSHRFCCQHSPGPPRPFFHERRHFPWYGGVVLPIYSMPYYYPPAIIEPVDDTMEQDYGQGPATFDRRKKIALADLDLTATQKQNEDRGIDFRLPARPGN